MQGRRLRGISIRHRKIDTHNQIKVDARPYILIKCDFFWKFDAGDLVLQVIQSDIIV